MLLAVDVGNTQTALGLYASAELRENWRLATERSTTADDIDYVVESVEPIVRKLRAAMPVGVR